MSIAEYEVAALAIDREKQALYAEIGPRAYAELRAELWFPLEVIADREAEGRLSQ